jgi:uncharacterized lipoprotein
VLTRFGWARATLLAGTVTVCCGLSACGGEANLACDEPQRYEESVDHSRLQAPDDLDAPESLREIPLPKANPRPERPPGSPCLDLPPRVAPTN